MKRTTLFVIAVVFALVAVAGAAQAQNGGNGDTDEVTFYGHVFGHGLPAPQPSNTEAPAGEDNYGFGTFEWCTPAAWASNANPDVVSPGSCEESPWNRLALFSTAGFVDVQSRTEFNEQGGYGLLHNERGQTKDVKLDTSGSITATVYGTVDYHSWFTGGQPYGTSCTYSHPPNVPCVYPYWGWDVGVQPNFVVEATLYQANLGERTESSSAPPVQEAIESGEAEVIAQGTWGPDTAMTGIPGASPNAMEFNVDLGAPQTDTISADNDFFLTYRVYSETPAGEVGIHSFRWWSGEFFPPTYTMPVENAFAVERTIPNFANGKLAVLGIMNTPWGSYDVDADSVEIEIEGPQGTVDTEHLDRYADFSVAHGGHYDPVNITWIWDYRQEDVSPGEYTVTVSASNYQGSASAECKAKFTIDQSGERLVPGGVQEGVCGTQTASQEYVEQVREGSEEQTGGS